MTLIEKKMKIANLFPGLAKFPMLINYFDLASNELLDEKINVLEMIDSGKSIAEIPGFYDIFELLPKDALWD